MRKLRLGSVGLAFCFLLLNLSRLFAVDSENPEAMRWFNLGLQENDAQKKIAAYAKAIELDPKFIEAYYNLGLAYRQAQDFVQAEKFLRSALEADPAKLRTDTKLQVKYELAATYKRQAKNKDYETTLLEAQALAQEAAIRNQINLELGRYYYEQGRYDEAAKTLRESGQLSAAEANEFDTLIRQAETAAELQKNYTAALKAKSSGNVGGALVLFEQAQSYERAGNLEMALASYESLLKLESSHLEARAKYETVKQQLAQKHLTDTLEREYSAGMTALKSRDWTRATLAFEKIFNNDSNYKDTRSRLAEAQKALDRESKETIAARYYVEGVTAMNRGDLDGALVALEKVSKINVQYRNTAGLLKQIEQALAQQPVAARPSNNAAMDSLYQTALASMEAKDWMQAVIILEKIALLAPNYREVDARLEHARTQLKLAAATEQTVAQNAEPQGEAPIWQNPGVLAALLLLPLLGFVAVSPATHARYYLMRNDFSAAAAIYEQLLARHPQRTKFYPALGNLYFLLGRRDLQAMKVYKTILQLNLPMRNREGINAIVAEHFLTEGRTDSDAIEVLENALKIEQNRYRG